MAAKLIALCAGLLCGLSVATAVFAYTAHLAPALGPPLWRQSIVAFYAPWDILRWAWWWAGVAPQAFQLPLLVGVLMAGITACKTWPRRVQTTQPQAHWATWAELKTAEVLGEEGTGIVLGKLWHLRRWILLRYHGACHVLVIAGTGTGKTASIVLPTLLDYRGSMIVHDPKGGLYGTSAGYRATLGKVILLAPLRGDTDQYNLWDAVRLRTDDEMRDVDMITHYLTQPDGTPIYDDTSQHFRDLVKQFFRGVFLYGLHTGLATTGAQFDELANQTEWEDLLAVMEAYPHPIVRRAARVARRPGERERGSLQTTMARALDMFVDPRVTHMTATSSFCLQDLRESPDPCSIYLCVPFADQERLRALVGVLLQVLIDQCTARLRGGQHGVLALIEEYPSLGKFLPISRALNYAREYGLQFCLVTPSMEELVHVYGQHHNFLEGCRIQAVFGLSDDTIAKRFAARAGTRERTRQRVTTQSRGGHSTTDDIKEEPLLNTTGFLDLGERDLAVFAGRYKRLCVQSRYYEHSIWAARAAIPPPKPE